MAQTTLSLAFIVLNIIGILLMAALVTVHILHRGPRSILIQMCILTSLHNIVTLPLVIVYGQDHMQRAPTGLCIAQAYLIQFLKLAAVASATCMALTLFLIVRLVKQDSERRYFKTFMFCSLGIPLILTSVAFVLWRNRPNMAAMPHAFYCRTDDDAVQFYTMRIPLMLMLLIGLFCTVSSVCGVFAQRRKVRRFGKTPDGKVIRSSLLIRLFVYTLMFCLITLMGNVQQVTGFLRGKVDPELKPGMTEWSTVVATFGLFLMFGTTRETAQTLLPCLPISSPSHSQSSVTSASWRSINASRTTQTTWNDGLQLERPPPASLSSTWSLDSPTQIPFSPTRGLASPTRWPGSPLRGPDSPRTPTRSFGSPHRLTVDTRTLGVRQLVGEGNSPASMMSDRSGASEQPLARHYNGRPWDGAASEDSADESTVTSTTPINMV